MALTYTLISTTTITSPSSTSILISNIPQTYTDLVVWLSVRCEAANSILSESTKYTFNGDTNNRNSNRAYAISGSFGADTPAGMTTVTIPGTAVQANNFGTATIYIPNYTTSLPKSSNVNNIAIDSSTAQLDMTANRWNSASAVTSITLIANGNFSTNTKVSLYGILRA